MLAWWQRFTHKRFIAACATRKVVPIEMIHWGLLVMDVQWLAAFVDERSGLMNDGATVGRHAYRKIRGVVGAMEEKVLDGEVH